MADQKKNSFDPQEKNSFDKEEVQPPQVTEKGSVYEASSLTGSSPHSSTSQILEAVSKPAGSHHEHNKDEDEYNQSWWLGGGGAYYGCRD